MLTVGVDDAAVESALVGGLLVCPVAGCGGWLRPWGWARERVVRGLVEKLRPRRSLCAGCRVSHVLLPASVLLRRADAVVVIGAGLLAAAGGAGHRKVAEELDRPESTVRGWLRRISQVADRVLAVLGVAAAGFGTEFCPPAPAAGRVGQVVEMLGAFGRAVGRRLGGSRSPWRLASSVTNGCLLAPGGPDPVAGVGYPIYTNWLLAAGV